MSKSTLLQKTKAELLDLAKTKNIAVTDEMTKDELADAILTSEISAPTEDPPKESEAPSEDLNKMETVEGGVPGGEGFDSVKGIEPTIPEGSLPGGRGNEQDEFVPKEYISIPVELIEKMKEGIKQGIAEAPTVEIRQKLEEKLATIDEVCSL